MKQQRARRLTSLHAGKFASLFLFLGIFVPSFGFDPKSLPVLIFWLLPVTLPFWFGLLAGFAFMRLEDHGNAGHWATVHTGITVLGVLLLPVWLLLSKAGGLVLDLTYLVAVCFIALIPAALKLFTGRSREWRLGRALWLNSIGCILFAFDFGAGVLRDVTFPGPAFVVGIPCLIIVAMAGRAFERSIPNDGRELTAHLPKALAREPGEDT